MAYLMFSGVLHEYLKSIRAVGMLFDLLHRPAEGLASLWICVFHLPPHGDAAWVVLPWAVVVQWLIIGLLLGFLSCRGKGSIGGKASNTTNSAPDVR